MIGFFADACGFKCLFKKAYIDVLLWPDKVHVHKIAISPFGKKDLTIDLLFSKRNHVTIIFFPQFLRHGGSKLKNQLPETGREPSLKLGLT